MGSLRLVQQQDATGCGIACVAMVANKRYSEVRRLFDQYHRRNNHNADSCYATNAYQLSKLLRRIGVDHCVKQAQSWDQIDTTAIVGVDRGSGGYFHWVVAVRGSKRFLILDPEYGEVLSGVEALRRRADYYQTGPWHCSYIDLLNKQVACIQLP